MEYKVHDKKLPIPSFFQVYNYGGGNGDKDREIVYAEFTDNTPALINYYYINNKIPHLFQSHAFDDISKYNKIGDLYNDIRQNLIKNGSLGLLFINILSKQFTLKSSYCNWFSYVGTFLKKSSIFSLYKFNISLYILTPLI